MNIIGLCGLIYILISKAISVSVTSQQYTVRMCTLEDGDCNLDAVKCNAGFVVNITELYYASSWKWWQNWFPFSNCPACCTNTDYRRTGNRLTRISDLCNNNEHCQITSEVMSPKNDEWTAKIVYRCIPPSTSTSEATTILSTKPTTSTSILSTTPTTSTTIISTKPTTPPTTTTSTAPTTIQSTTPTPTNSNPELSTVTTLTSTTTAKTGGYSKQSKHEDEFPTAVAVSVPLVLLVIGVVIFIVIWFLRKRGYLPSKTSNKSRALDDSNGLDQMAMENRTYEEHNLEENSYSYIKEYDTPVSRDSGYVETFVSTEKTTNRKNNTSDVRHNADNIYSNITNSQSATEPVDASYSHITGVQGLNHVEVVGADPSDTNDITYTFLQSTDTINIDERHIPDMDEYADEYNHTNIRRSKVSRNSNEFPANTKENNDEYNHIDFVSSLTTKEGAIRLEGNDLSSNSIGMHNVKPLNTNLKSSKGDPGETNCDINSTNGYETISGVNDAATIRDTSKDENNGQFNMDNRNNTYSYARENSVPQDNSSLHGLENEPHDYFVLENK